METSGTNTNEQPKPLEPSERIELEMFKRVLQDAVEGDDDIAQIFATASDLILSGSMGKDDALRGAITCLVVRVKTFKDEARALHVENTQWREKWQAAVDQIRPIPDPIDHALRTECAAWRAELDAKFFYNETRSLEVDVECSSAEKEQEMAESMKELETATKRRMEATTRTNALGIVFQTVDYLATPQEPANGE